MSRYSSGLPFTLSPPHYQLCQIPTNDSAFTEKRLKLIEDRILLLRQVDVEGPQLSRLLGFLQFRRHGILIEVVAMKLKQNSSKSKSLESLRDDLSASLNTAWTILQNDASCPTELTNLITLLNASK